MPFSNRVEACDEKRGVRAGNVGVTAAFERIAGLRSAFDFGVAFNLRQSVLLRLFDDLVARDDLDAGAERGGDAAILYLGEFDGTRDGLLRNVVASDDAAQFHSCEGARVLCAALAANLHSIVRDALALL